MAKNGLKCPDCGTLVKKPPAGLAGVVQCPECQTEIWYDPRLDGEREGLRTQPSPEPPPLWAQPVDDETPARRRPKKKRPAPPAKKPGGSGLAIGACIAAVLVLVIGGGGVFALWKWQSAPASGPGLMTSGTNDGTIPLETLKHLKRATVFIKVQRGGEGATGSGFVMRQKGDATYVVTNNHVVTLPNTRPDPFGPMRPPFGPGGRIGPFLPGFGGGPPSVTLVFHSGSPQEETLPATVVHADPVNDLALLVTRGVKDVPRPIQVDQRPKLVETMPLLIFGFPFGEDLAVDNGNPAITVSKGGISSLRYKAGELEVVQIDGELNPGNSGGPVTDVTGQLVGVAVAKVRNANKIGMAVPAHEVEKLFPLTEKQPLAAVPPNDVAQGPVQPPPAAPVNPPPQPPAPQPKPLTKDQLDKALADLRQKDHWTPLNAARLLAGAEPTDERRDDVVKALEETVTTTDFFVKMDAVKALDVWGPKGHVPALVKLITDGNPFIRRQAMEALGKRPDPRTAEAVAALLDHKDWTVRMDLCDLLGKVGTRASIASLEAARKEGGLVARRAEDALRVLRERLDRKAEADEAVDF